MKDRPSRSVLERIAYSSTVLFSTIGAYLSANRLLECTGSDSAEYLSQCSVTYGLIAVLSLTVATYSGTLALEEFRRANADRDGKP